METIEKVCRHYIFLNNIILKLNIGLNMGWWGLNENITYFYFLNGNTTLLSER